VLKKGNDIGERLVKPERILVGRGRKIPEQEGLLSKLQ